MIEGTVTDEGVPLIELELGGRRWETIVDTGFNGDLELPVELQDILPTRLLGQVISTLAGGQSIEEDAYRIEMEFDGESVRPEVTFAPETQILLGTRLLRSHYLEINFLDRTVLIRRVG